jgi:hypothetical protein
MDMMWGSMAVSSSPSSSSCLKIQNELTLVVWISVSDPDPHQFVDDKPKCMKYEPILALFQGFEPLFGS